MDFDNQELVQRLYTDEATSAHIYTMLAQRTTSAHNRQVLEAIAKDEEKHAAFWAGHLKAPAAPHMHKVRLFLWLARLFGLSFVINILESMEVDASESYAALSKELPFAKEMLADEKRHEETLAAMVEDDGLSYIGSMVLGVSDAVVELTGTLAGFTLALSSTTMVALAGFITGIAATLSMASSEYLSTKADPNGKSPIKAAAFTGVSYLFTVLLLLAPYVLVSNPLVALGICLAGAAVVIAGFSFFSAVVRKTSFWKGFREMICISFGVALISFCIGWAARVWLNLSL